MLSKHPLDGNREKDPKKPQKILLPYKKNSEYPPQKISGYDPVDASKEY